MSNQVEVAEVVSPLTREQQVRNVQNLRFLKTPHKYPMRVYERQSKRERERGKGERGAVSVATIVRGNRISQVKPLLSHLCPFSPLETWENQRKPSE